MRLLPPPLCTLELAAQQAGVKGARSRSMTASNCCEKLQQS